MTTLSAPLQEAFAAAEAAKAETSTAPAAEVFEEGSATTPEVYADPFKGALAGAPLVSPPPLPAEDPRSPGTRVVPVSPAESGVRQQPSMAALASEAAVRATSEPNRATNPAPEAEGVVQFPGAAPQAAVQPATQAAVPPATTAPQAGPNWWARSMGVIAALSIAFLLLGGAAIAIHRAQLQAELVTAQGVVTELRVEISQAKARISALRSALTYEQGRPWWSRLNKWW